MSDALYHDAEHTAQVTLVAQDILRRLRLRVASDPLGPSCAARGTSGSGELLGR